MTQVLAVNLLLIVAAVVAAIIASSPRFELPSTPEAGLVLGLAVSLTVLVNVFLLQRRMRPLESSSTRWSVPTSRGRARTSATRPGLASPEVERLHDTFRRMLERLESERRRASSAALRRLRRRSARESRAISTTK